MRISLLQLSLIFLGVCLAFGEQIEEAPPRNFFKKLFTKTKSGLGKVRRSLSVNKNKAVREKNPLEEGVAAVLDVIDEYVAEGEKTAKRAAKDSKNIVEETEESAKNTFSEAKDKLDAVGAEVKSMIDSALDGAAADVDAIRESVVEDVIAAKEAAKASSEDASTAWEL